MVIHVIGGELGDLGLELAVFVGVVVDVEMVVGLEIGIEGETEEATLVFGAHDLVVDVEKRGGIDLAILEDDDATGLLENEEAADAVIEDTYGLIEASGDGVEANVRDWLRLRGGQEWGQAECKKG